MMLDSDPMEYATMWINGTLQEYVDRIDGVAGDQMKRYVEQLSEWYSPNIVEDIARKMLMYE